MSADPRLQGIQVRYDGRTLRVAVVCDRRPVALYGREVVSEFTGRLQVAARGSAMKMAVVFGPAFARTDIDAVVFVNTDEFSEVLEDRLRKAIEHEGIDGAVLTIEELEPVKAMLFWDKMFNQAVDSIAAEKHPPSN